MTLRYHQHFWQCLLWGLQFLKCDFSPQLQQSICTHMHHKDFPEYERERGKIKVKGKMTAKPVSFNPRINSSPGNPVLYCSTYNLLATNSIS